jgi:hypothetical protein
MPSGVYKHQKHSEERKRKISLSNRGKHSYLIGRKVSEETKLKMSLAHTGEKAWNWKGNNVSYRNLHRWVERQLGKANKCMKNLAHKSTRYHWANISKEYKRELSDWIQLCPSCNLKDRIGRRVSP